MAERLTLARALNLAAQKHSKGDLNVAEVIYRKILNKDPWNPNALHLLGLIAHQVGKSDDAINLIEKAIQLKPNTALFHGNLGMVYDALGKEQKATKHFSKALEIDPTYAKAYLANYNLGVYCMGRGKIMQALEHYEKSIALEKNFPEAHWNRGLILLLLGRLEDGWSEFEYRFRKESPTDSRNFGKPKWDGSSLQGKRILVLTEQGFGDDIQFSRYLPLIKEKGGYVIFECKNELKRLFDDLPGVDEFVEKSKGSPDVQFECYVHLLSLPKIFETKLDTIPPSIFLRSRIKISARVKEKLKSDRFKIGIAWAGNPEQGDDKNRSTTFDKFKVLKDIKRVQLFSLQKGAAQKQLNDSDVIDMAEEINDFADTASIINNFDLIISVDTSIVHLAGAMGKPVWILLAYRPAWRWLLNRTDCPWYPTMRLFRQKKSGDWDSVLVEVCEELRKRGD